MMTSPKSKTRITRALIVFAIAAFLLGLLPSGSYALTRSEARLNAALVRPADDSGNTGASGSSTGGISGGGTSSTNAQGADSNQQMAEEMFNDLIQNGPDTTHLPAGTDLDSEEVTEAVEEIPTDEAPAQEFAAILNTIISRFTNR